MSDEPLPREPGTRRDTAAEAVLNALPLPVLTIGADEQILHCNHAAEAFFDYSARLMQRRRLRDIIPFASPIIALVAEVRRRRASVSEYRVELTQPRLGLERSVDVFATPLGDDGEAVVMMLQERTIADKMNRQLTHRGAAQLLESTGAEEDRLLTRLICDESDRIVRIVERMELFGDERPSDRGAVNVHGVLDQVKR